MHDHNIHEDLVLRHLLTVGASVSLSVGFLDLTISILSDPAPGRLQSPEAVLASLCATIFATMAAFFVLWNLLLLVLRRDAINRISAPTGIAVFLGTFFVFYCVSLRTSKVLIYIPFLMISLLCAVSSFYFIRFNRLSRAQKGVFWVAMSASPVVLGETLAMSWLLNYQWPSLTPGLSALAYSFWIGCIFLTFVFFWKITTRLRAIMLLGLLALVPASLFAWQFVESRHLTDHFNGGHRIQHVILITVDTLRADALSCYASKGASTPHMDRIGQESILFRNAFSPSPWTWPSLVSIMTGASPILHGALKYNIDIPEVFPTLAEHMKQSGYLTSAFVHNPIIAKKGMSRGFMEYESFPKPPQDASLGSALLDRIFPKLYEERISTSELTGKVSEWLVQHSETDFFLWVHYFDPHLPYDPPSQYLPPGWKEDHLRRVPSDFAKKIREGYRFPDLREREEIKQLYLGEVQYVDDSLGRLIEELKALHIYDDSLLILSSDHGEEFWEHQGFEHGHTLYNELLRVPLMVKLPGSSTRLEVDKIVSTESIMPTIEELCGIRDTSELHTSGSLVGLWKKATVRDPESILLAAGNTYYEPRVALVSTSFKYIVSLITGKEEYFDVENDPEEQFPITDDQPEMMEKARNMLQHKIHAKEDLRRRMKIDNEMNVIDRETEERLKSLGYVQ